jgi:hypothetical protein
MMNSTSLGISITDHEGTIIRKNTCYDAIVAGKRMVQVGVKPWEIYKGWFTSYGQPLKPQDWPVMQAITTGQPVLRLQIYIQRLDSSLGTILESATPITDFWGRVSGAIVITQDITGQDVALWNNISRAQAKSNLIFSD